MNKLLFPAIICLLLLSAPISSAWDWDAHQWLAEKLCSDYNCGCSIEIKNGSIAPDKVFRDTVNHHLYDPSTCVPSQNYTCPTKYDAVALEKADYWLGKAKSDTGCDRWYDIGVASHYFFDTKVIWHQIQNEDYDKCHAPFETAVGDKFKKNSTNWTVCKCDACVSYNDFPGWVSEFERKLDFVSQTGTVNATPAEMSGAPAKALPSVPQASVFSIVDKTKTPTPASTTAVAGTQTPKQPGFEMVFAVVGLIAFAYLIKRKS